MGYAWLGVGPGCNALQVVQMPPHSTRQLPHTLKVNTKSVLRAFRHNYLQFTIPNFSLYITIAVLPLLGRDLYKILPIIIEPTTTEGRSAEDV